MGKTLATKLKKFGKTLCLIGGMSTLGGCPNECTPVVNYTPTAIISAANPSMKVGETNYLNASGTDESGNEDILEYRLAQDKNANDTIDDGEDLTPMSAVPISDIPFTPTVAGTYKFLAECIDTKGAVGKASIEVIVSNSDIPVGNLSGVDLTGIDGKTLTKQLPLFTDTDTAGNIPYKTTVEVIEGSEYVESVSITPEGLLTVNFKEITEPRKYGLKFKAGTTEGGIGFVEKTNQDIENRCRIKGKLESDEEPNVSKAGILELYDKVTNTLLGTIDTTTGIYDIEANAPASEVRLEGRLNGSLPGTKNDSDGDNFRSVWYFDGTRDHSDVYVISVPADSDLDGDGHAELDTNTNHIVSEAEKEDFRIFSRRLNFLKNCDINSYDGLKKWNYGEIADVQKFEGVQIVSYFLGTQFTDDQRGSIGIFLKASGELGATAMNIVDDIDSEKHYTIYGNTNQYILPNKGWGIIIPAPYNSLGNGIAATTIIYDNDTDGYIERFETHIDLNYVNQTVTAHEYLHGKGFVGHGNEDPDTGNPVASIYSAIMNQGSLCTQMQVQEKKLDYIIKNSKYPAMKLDTEILK